MSEWTWDDTADLLTYIAGYNGREPGQIDMLAWTDAAIAGRWRLDLARAAVTAHHLESDDLIKPSHVHRRVRAAVRDELDRLDHTGEIEAPKRKRPVAALIGRLAGAWAPPEVEGPELDAAPVSASPALLAIAVPCEHCKVPAGSPCIKRNRTGAVSVAPHPSRHDDLEQAAKEAGLSVWIDAPAPCPTCGARANVRCVNLSTGMFTRFVYGTHYNRMVAQNDEGQREKADRAAAVEASRVQALDSWGARDRRDIAEHVPDDRP